MKNSLFPDKRLADWVVPVGLFLGVFFLVGTTISDYGLTWDEPSYFHASDLHVRWLADLGKNLFNGQIDKNLQDKTLTAAWHWDPYHIPHPPFSRILSGLTKALFSPVMDKFTAYRLAPALFFALLVTVMYLWMAQLFTRITGLFSAVTLVLMPNLFGFAHFAVTDMPLTVMWFLTVYCFWKGLKDWRWSLVLGLVWGLALATKFPAFLIPIPLLLWAHLYHRHSYHNNVFAMSFFSPIVMISVQPYLWHKTLPRLVMFLYDSVSRGFQRETNFTIFFLHNTYTSSTVPWYYPFFMTVVTIPAVVLLFCLVGAVAMPRIKPQGVAMILFFLNAMFILVIGLFPGAVLHDINRLLLPVLPFLAGLAGCGFFVLVRLLTEQCQTVAYLQRVRHLPEKLIGLAFLVAVFLPALDLLTYHPYELSYYNRLIGGIRGAYQRGLEVTYFMDALTPDFLRFLNKNLPHNAIINASFANGMFDYYQKEGLLRPDFKFTGNGNFDYYVLVSRQSAFSKGERARFYTAHPRYAVRLAGVPLVSVYKAKASD
ncbi:MAG: ArnT family glycosyltransferase [Candidatus Binatia bacterium]